jgi:hypothetical protein
MVRWKTHYFGHVVGKGMDVVNRSKWYHEKVTIIRKVKLLRSLMM